MLAVALAITYIVVRSSGHRLKFPPDSVAAVALLLLALGSQAWSVAPEFSTWTAFLYACCALLVISVRTVPVTATDVRILLRWLAFGGVLAGASLIISGYADPLTGRISLPGINTNNVSYGLAVGMVAALLLLHLGRPRDRLASIPIVAVTTWAAALTETRGTLIAMGAAGALALIRMLPSKNVTVLAVPLYIGAWVGLGYGLLAALGWVDLGWLTGLFQGRTPGDAALSGRLGIWEEALWDASAHSVLGMGAGGFARVNPFGSGAHNAFLTLRVDLGVVGLGLFACIVASQLSAIRRLRPRDKVAGLSVFYAWWPIAMSGVIETNPAWYLLLGLMPALGMRSETDGQAPPQPARISRGQSARSEGPVPDRKATERAT